MTDTDQPNDESQQPQPGPDAQPSDSSQPTNDAQADARSTPGAAKGDADYSSKNLQHLSDLEHVRE
ncbi:MAG: hypothetical protein KDA92_19760, partial [Planctomycetales bacterium]|nr:hypothetical protein [Planctomycetales bacterium]